MKRISAATLFFVGLLLVVPITASAHIPINNVNSNPLDPPMPRAMVLVGPRVGATRNFHTGGFRTINDPNCPVFESGSGWGVLLGFTAEFQTGESWSIVPAISYESRPGNFHQQLPDAAVLLQNETNPVNQSVSTTSEVRLSMLQAEVMYKQEIAKIGTGFRLAATAGPTAAYILSGRITQVQDLETPANARFLNPLNLQTRNAGRTLVFAEDSTISGLASTRFSIKGGIQAEIPLFGNQWLLYPGVFFDYGLTDVTRNENWSLNTILFQVDLRRAF